MKKCTKISILAFVIIICITTISIKINAYQKYAFENIKNSFIKSNNNDKVCYVTYDNNNIEINVIKTTGECYTKKINISLKVMSVNIINDTVLIGGNVSLDNGEQYISQILFIKYNINDDTIEYMIIYDEYLLSDNAVSTDGEKIYIIDCNTSTSVNVYNMKCGFLYSIDIEQYVKQIKYIKSDNKIYFCSGQGLYYEEVNNKELKKVNFNNEDMEYIPIGNNYYVADGVQIFKNTKKAYNAYVKDNPIIYKNGIVYIADKNNVIGYCENGQIIKKISLDENIKQIVALKDSISVLTDSGGIYLYKDNEILDVEQVTNKKENKEEQTENSSKSNIKIDKEIVEKYSVDYKHNLIYVDKNTTIAYFKKDVKNNDAIEIYNKNKVLKTTGVIGTNYVVKLNDKKDKSTSYNVVVYADVTGEGNINSRDISVVLNELNLKTKLDITFIKAGDVNKNNVIDVVDLIKISKEVK